MSLNCLKRYALDLLGPALARRDEPLSGHTTFKVGGPADLYVRPEGPDAEAAVASLLRAARSEGVGVFVLGGGANLVVSDRGIRGLVLDTSGLSGFEASPVADRVSLGAGLSVDAAVDACLARGLSCLESMAGMPGSVGGAVWMNARCYGLSVSDRLLETLVLNEDLEREVVPFDPGAFAYKKSPFQTRSVFILSALFRAETRAEAEIRAEAVNRRADRESKGHFKLPSAGSSFKNDYAYGKPTGQIVDELGLRGLAVGGAQVAPWHGNIIVNTGNASAADIRSLSRELERRVFDALGLRLETEMLFVGDWPD